MRPNLRTTYPRARIDESRRHPKQYAQVLTHSRNTNPSFAKLDWNTE